MRIAVVGSRNLNIENMEDYIPIDTDEIVTGGAKGIDKCAVRFAQKIGIKYTEILPNYKKYGIAAPIVRNKKIVKSVEAAVIFWDGKSKGTKSVIDFCNEFDVPIILSIIKK